MLVLALVVVLVLVFSFGAIEFSEETLVQTSFLPFLTHRNFSLPTFEVLFKLLHVCPADIAAKLGVMTNEKRIEINKIGMIIDFLNTGS